MEEAANNTKSTFVKYTIIFIMGLSLLSFVLATEIINPHNPSESLFLRWVFVAICAIPTSVATYGFIFYLKEFLLIKIRKPPTIDTC